MKKWHKVILLVATITIISLFIKWWMSYEPMQLIVENDTNRSINVSIGIEGMDKKIYLNESFVLEAGEIRKFENITNLAGEYFLKVDANNESVNKKIKFGKYFEKIEVHIGEGGIRIENKHE